MKRTIAFLLMIALLAPSLGLADSLQLTMQYQEPTVPKSPRFHRLQRSESWESSKTAVIVCDMWDSHHCVNAVRRVAQLAPRIDRFCDALRDRGVTIIHAPSSCMDAYQNHPARIRAAATPLASSLPTEIASWCDQIPSEERAAYPIDQAEGGEDDDPEDHRLWAEHLESIGRNPRSPWKRQVANISIDEKLDFISDSGTEIWSLLSARGIENVILTGVHTNMCVLGRPFGLRRLASNGKNVVLARDLTDTMYDPNAWPYASHFTGTDLIVDHIERWICPTVTSDQILGDQPFSFARDQRLKLLVIVAEDEYETEQSLPDFAAKHLSEHFSVQFAWGSATERHKIVGIDAVRNADAILISVRRRALPPEDLQSLRDFVSSGKPVIGIRTASHAFSLRGKAPPQGHAVWETFDADVFGGNYTNHYGNQLKSTVQVAGDNGTGNGSSHPILRSTDTARIQPGGSLYKTAPLYPGTRVLVEGIVSGDQVKDEPPQPVAWTFIRADSGRSFYTSLGHRDDFKQAEFESLLAAGIHWACGLDPHSLTEIKHQNERYQSGHGRQRK